MRLNLHGCRIVGSPWLGSTLCALTLVVGAWTFLPSQVVWLDEATQLVGLRLDPFQVARWLARTEAYDSGQFLDRMPPVSYWLGWSWGRAFGIEEASMRWFGVACVATATALVFLTARRAFGARAGWAAGMLFASSPGIVMIAVEIRAYPLLLLTSAAACYALIRLTEGISGPGAPGRWTWLAILSLTLATAVGVHFFGIVLAGAVLSTLAVYSRKARRPIGGLVAASGVVGLAVLGDVPFALASVSMAHGPSGLGVIARLESVYKLLLELHDHPALMIDGTVEACFLLGLAILIVGAIRLDSEAKRALALMLGLGLGAVASVQLAVGREGFNACSVNYNLWMKPGLCLVGAAGLASRTRAIRRSAGLAVCLILATQGIGVVQLAYRGDYFAHCAHGAVASMIRGLRSTDLAVVHDDGSAQFVFVANPVRLAFGPDLEQFRLLDGTGGSLVVPMKGDPTPRPIEALPHRYLLLIRCSPTGDRGLVGQIRSGDRAIGPGPILTRGHASSGRRLVRADLRVARISARMDVFERLER